MGVVRLKFVATLSKCWVPIFRHSRLSRTKKNVRFFSVQGTRAREIWMHSFCCQKSCLGLMHSIFSIMSKIIKTNSTEQKKRRKNETKNETESRCLDDKKGFNDTSQIFTSDVNRHWTSAQQLPLNNGKPARFLQVNWIRWEFMSLFVDSYPLILILDM